MNSVPESNFDIEVFYDGDCPLCNREIAFLRWMDSQQRIRFKNIAAGEFDESDDQPGYEELMAEIHGRLPDGSWIKGVEVFRRLYSVIGWRWAVAWTRLPVVRQLCDVLYCFFARHRLRITGRCNKSCASLPSRSTHSS